MAVEKSLSQKKKKAFFIFNATTHYYNLVLNKLNEKTDYEIHLVVPKDRVRNVGAGVYQTSDNLKVPLHELEELNTRFLGCHFPELPDLLRKEKPDLVVTLTTYQKGLFFSPLNWLLLKLNGTKVILKNIPFRLSPYENPFRRLKGELGKSYLGIGDLYRNKRKIVSGFLEKWFYSKAYDAHVCYIEKAYELYPTYGVDPRSIFITYNSPDTDRLLEMNEAAKLASPILEENPYRLLHVGRLVDWKRLDLIIRAVHHLQTKFPRIELVVIGYGPQKEEWENLAKELGVSDRIKFVGGVYDPLLLGRYMRASQIYVLGGMGGLSINDAMCFERPILCSECDGTEEKLVRDGFNGYYFRNGDYQDLASKIDLILSSPDLAQKMGANSLSIIKNEININKVLDGYTKAFEFALHGPPSRDA